MFRGEGCLVPQRRRYRFFVVFFFADFLAALGLRFAGAFNVVDSNLYSKLLLSNCGIAARRRSVRSSISF